MPNPVMFRRDVTLMLNLDNIAMTRRLTDAEVRLIREIVARNPDLRFGYAAIQVEFRVLLPNNPGNLQISAIGEEQLRRDLQRFANWTQTGDCPHWMRQEAQIILRSGTLEELRVLYYAHMDTIHLRFWIRPLLTTSGRIMVRTVGSAVRFGLGPVSNAAFLTSLAGRSSTLIPSTTVVPGVGLQFPEMGPNIAGLVQQILNTNFGIANEQPLSRRPEVMIRPDIQVELLPVAERVEAVPVANQPPMELVRPEPQMRDMRGFRQQPGLDLPVRVPREEPQELIASDVVYFADAIGTWFLFAGRWYVSGIDGNGIPNATQASVNSVPGYTAMELQNIVAAQLQRYIALGGSMKVIPTGFGYSVSKMDKGHWNVNLSGQFVAQFATQGKAKNHAKRGNLMLMNLVKNSIGVASPGYGNAWDDFILQASNPANGFNPPLVIAS